MNPLKPTPRLRMFAGPNGSGKSTIKSLIGRELLGVYVNPDEIEAEIRLNDVLDLGSYPFETNEKEILEFFNSSTLLGNAGLLDEAARLTYNQRQLVL
jgi:predicted ATPase